jgi:hypothetical protein
MIRYTSENQGYNKNRLLHSVPYGSNREKVTVYVSYDEGETWPVSKYIVPYSSAYSSLCILPDGTIGLYVEEAYAGASGYSTVFYNFSLEWLTDGEDTVEPNGVADDQHALNTLMVYPSPASSFVTIETEGLMAVNILNGMGQLVKSVRVDGDSHVEIDVAGFSPGIYFVEGIEVNGGRKIGRLIVAD